MDVFFVISGYLITRITSREMAQGRFTFASFYECRERRIFPALFAVTAVTLGTLELFAYNHENILRTLWEGR